MSGKRIAVLGFAFKKDTNDTRESAAIHVCRELMEERASLAIFDPKVEVEQMCKDLEITQDSSNVEFSQTAQQAALGAHALLVLTEWDEFRDLDFEAIYKSMVKPAWVFDGRSLLDHDRLRRIGFRVYSVGKPLTLDVKI